MCEHRQKKTHCHLNCDDSLLRRQCSLLLALSSPSSPCSISRLRQTMCGHRRLLLLLLVLSFRFLLLHFLLPSFLSLLSFSILAAFSFARLLARLFSLFLRFSYLSLPLPHYYELPLLFQFVVPLLEERRTWKETEHKPGTQLRTARVLLGYD